MKPTSKLTEKYQATIPKSIRQFLHLQKGDRITFEIDDDRVLLHRTSPFDLEYLAALEPTLSEWTSDDDEKAYKDLSAV